MYGSAKTPSQKLISAHAAQTVFEVGRCSGLHTDTEREGERPIASRTRSSAVWPPLAAATREPAPLLIDCGDMGEPALIWKYAFLAAAMPFKLLRTLATRRARSVLASRIDGKAYPGCQLPAHSKYTVLRYR